MQISITEICYCKYLMLNHKSSFILQILQKSINLVLYIDLQAQDNDD